MGESLESFRDSTSTAKSVRQQISIDYKFMGSREADEDRPFIHVKRASRRKVNCRALRDSLQSHGPFKSRAAVR